MASLKILIVSYITLLSLFHFEFSNANVKGGYWSPDDGLEASAIDSTLFTHLFCAFANLNLQTYQLTISQGCQTFPQTIRRKNLGIKAILSIGGGSAKSSDYNNMASQPSSRKAFIDSSISLAKRNGYNGLDLDWEQQSKKEEMDNMATLLTEWRAAIKAQAPNLILTAALPFTPIANSVATFPVKAISDNLDWVNVMAYDFYAPGYGPPPYFTHPHAALYDPSGAKVSGSDGIKAWIKAGVPAKKLVLGVPFYGHAWTLANSNNNGILAPATNNENTLVPEGTPKYMEIKPFISKNGAKVVYNSSYVFNYCYSGTTWIAYDDTQAIATKVAYAKRNALNGYFAWKINQDLNWALSTKASQTWGS
ncbi:acidic mammalian chitinase-like [Chenopodium quinoa]|uniref:acidic mammalian chitinase-like n=1 Tax=Chenopodium quinoa TaxID=63459 RepID=UPI000B778D40|nr:acidic mammalian chitinase-like [Chenopodium quinoa]